MDRCWNLKELIWVGTTLKVVRSFPGNVRRAAGFALYQAQEGKKHIWAKPLKGFSGSKVLEIVDNRCGNAYRVVYTVMFSRTVYVLHAFKKKSTRGIKTPYKEIKLIKERLREAAAHHTKNFE